MLYFKLIILYYHPLLIWRNTKLIYDSSIHYFISNCSKLSSPITGTIQYYTLSSVSNFSSIYPFSLYSRELQLRFVFVALRIHSQEGHFFQVVSFRRYLIPKNYFSWSYQPFFRGWYVWVICGHNQSFLCWYWSYHSNNYNHFLYHSVF